MMACGSGGGSKPDGGAAGHGGAAGGGGNATPTAGTGGEAGASGAGGTSGATGGTTSTGAGGATGGATSTGGGGATGGTTSVGGGGGGSGGTTPVGGRGGLGGTTSTGGAGASGGTSAGGRGGAGGTAPMGGRGGAGGTTGGAGTGGAQSCVFQIDAALSTVIPTVGIVNWSTDLAGLTSARIEFTLNDPPAGTINRGSGGSIDIAGTSHRALMLGLKPARIYTYRIIATAGTKVCTSPDRTLTTGSDADAAKIVLTSTRNAAATATPATGFIVTSDYQQIGAYIIDADGDIVWLADDPSVCSRARMDWEGQYMWMLTVNGTQGSPWKVRRTSMDGTDVLEDFPELKDAHHDLAVAPGGVVATVVWTGETTAASVLVERSPDGTVKTIGRIAENVFGSRASYHANSIAYHPSDDTYTVGDLDNDGFVKMTRAGKVVWKFQSADFVGNHGHHLFDGGLLVFKARVMPSPVLEYKVIEGAGTLTATQIWSYTPTNNQGSIILGDVQRLPNGNTLITYSNGGEIREVSPAGDIVRSIVTGTPSGGKRQMGYADYRETLYGPPLR
jgi:hypothetical protein